MTQYDPKILQKYADRLYTQANTIIFIWSIAGIMVGALGGYLLGSITAARENLAVLGTAIVGLFGFLIGRERAFELKFRAQTALCQVKIEENTRGRE